MEFSSHGPLVQSWCMRYEAKHHYFKRLGSFIGNYTNLPYSMSIRHQQRVSYQLQCGNHESSFIEKAPEIPITSKYIKGNIIMRHIQSVRAYDK